MWSNAAIAMYHYVRNVEETDFPGIKALPVQDFIDQLAWFESVSTILDYKTFTAHLLSGKKPEGATALLTFDDGFIDIYETVFPLLIERGLSGVFFLCDSTFTDRPELINVHKVHFLLSYLGQQQFDQELMELLRSHEAQLDQKERDGLYVHDEGDTAALKRLLNYELPYDIVDAVLEELFSKHLGDASAFAQSLYVTPAQISEMAEAGMTFGAHTKTHRVLSRLSADEQREQLQDGIALIRELTGQEHVPFCYPYGLSHTYDEHTLGHLRDLGYHSAFTVGRAYATYDPETVLEIPRFDTNDFPPRSEEPPSY